MPLSRSAQMRVLLTLIDRIVTSLAPPVLAPLGLAVAVQHHQGLQVALPSVEMVEMVEEVVLLEEGGVRYLLRRGH